MISRLIKPGGVSLALIRGSSPLVRDVSARKVYTSPDITELKPRRPETTEHTVDTSSGIDERT